MARYALVNKDSEVENVILWDSKGNEMDFGELRAVKSDVAQIGQVFDGKSFSDKKIIPQKSSD